jgi:hypothetical protein
VISGSAFAFYPERTAMKKTLMGAAMLLALVTGAAAQGSVKTKAPKKAKTSEPVRLQSESAHTAMAPATTRFSIADPVVNFYNGRVAGAIPDEDVRRPIIGMPRLRYGVAHGHLLFYNTTATSAGGNTGTGSVGTGNSAGNLGVNGVAQGVNGKNPYSGPGIYGNRVRLSGRPVTLPPSPLRDKEQPDQRP